MSQAFYVAGTGTDVGKTFFASLFMAKYARKFDFKYWKLIQTGISQQEDTALVKKVTGLGDSCFLKPIFNFHYPSSPHLAARMESAEIDVKHVLSEMKARRGERVMIEGAGGVFVPLTDEYLSWQSIRESNLKVVVVCSTELGTINHTLMTLECLLQRFIPVIGFYMVGPKNDLIEDNIVSIQRFGGVPCLGETVFPDQNLRPADFTSYANSEFDKNKLVIESIMEADDSLDP